MVTTSLEYSHTIGIASFEGRGFMNPIDIKFKNDLLFVLSRSNASNKNNRVSAVSLQSDHKFEFANWGEDNGQSILPTSIAFDLDNKFYLSDEHLNRISIFDLEGNFIEKWGEYGTEKGKLNRPSGISINSDNELLVVDHLNSRIQKFDTKGNFINSFGEFGNLEGQFNYPWGLSIDAEDNIYVADWRNNRIQIFNKKGEFIKIIKSFQGKNLNKPSSVHLDKKGVIYISNWGDDNVVVFDKSHNFSHKIIGDATLSKWCKEFLDVNPEQSSWRESAGLFEEEKRFWKPSGIETNDDFIFITDSCRHRVQIYKK